MASPLLHEVELVIPQRSVGSVIGSKGATIQEIQSKSQARVKVDREEREDGRLVVVSGSLPCILVGLSQIAVNLGRCEGSLRLHAPSTFFSSSPVAISFSRAARHVSSRVESSVESSGGPDAVESALRGEGGGSDSVLVRMQQPAELLGVVELLWALVSKDALDALDASVAQARVRVCFFAIPSSAVGALIGPGGSVIKALRKGGVELWLPPRGEGAAGSLPASFASESGQWAEAQRLLSEAWPTSHPTPSFAPFSVEEVREKMRGGRGGGGGGGGGGGEGRELEEVGEPKEGVSTGMYGALPAGMSMPSGEFGKGDSFKALFFPSEEAHRELVRTIAMARKSLDVCVFSFTDNALSDTLIDLHRAGVKVRVITDDVASKQEGADAAALAAAGIPLRTDASEDLMHHKFAVIDGKVLLTGSYNWTRAAALRNAENLLVLVSARAAQPYTDHFNLLWNTFGPEESEGSACVVA